MGNLIVGIDCQFQQISESENELLCYAWYCIGGSGHSFNTYVPGNGKRLKLQKLVKIIVEDAIRQGATPKAPCALYIVSYYTPGLISHLKDFKSIYNKFQTVSGAFTRTQTPLSIAYTNTNKRPIKTKLFLYDTKLISPDKIDTQALSVHFNLSTTTIKNYAGNHQLYDFEVDALRKSEIAAKYFDYFKKFASDELITANVPATIGSCAEKLLYKILDEQNYCSDYVLGYDEHKIEHFNETTLRYSTYQAKVPNLFRDINQSLVDESFHGGRNESYYYGITPDDAWKDWDIISAYTTVMAMLNPLFYSAAYESNAVNNYHYSTYGYAYLSFQFPAGVNYPCLPVRTQNGLVFPLAGETFATAPEIYLANSLGCKIEIQKGIVIPVDESGGHPFLPFVKHIQQKRNLPNQTTLGNTLWKQIGNSLYGKISQGSKTKRLYDPRIGNSKYIKPSKCSNLYFGAYTTGYLRALIAEIMNKIPADKDIISVTTDGFISNASDSQIKDACTGEIAQLFSSVRTKISGESCILKEKYAVKSLLSWRTRGQATIKQMDGSDDIILAKSGIKTPYTDKFNQNKFIVDLFLQRNRKTTMEISFPKPLQIICKTGCDQTLVTRSIRVNMDYDFKRFLCRPFELEYSGKSILCFKTSPHKTIDNFNALSMHLHNYQISNYNFMTSVENLRDFSSYIKTSVAQATSGVIVQRTKRRGRSDLDVAMKTFFKAYTRQALGLERTFTYKSLASWLTDNNYACNESTIKNCAKSKSIFHFNSVPKTKATLAFVEFIKSKFTNFEDTKFFS